MHPMRFLPVLLTPALWLPAQAMPQEAAVDLALAIACTLRDGPAKCSPTALCRP